MSWQLMKFRDFLKRSKIPIDIQDNELYKRVTIKIKHNGVSLRDEEIGKKIGTKKQFILKDGQFILSKIDARYGAFGIAPEEVDGAIITGNFWAYDVDFSLVNIEWFNQFTNSQDFYDLCERASSGITHRKYLNEDSFLDNEIYLPSPEEQLQIIEEFKTNRETINVLSIELTHQLDLVKQLRQAFLREAMQGKLVPQDPNDEPASVLLEKIKAEKERLIKEKKIKKQKPLPPITEEEIPFEIPENWVWCRLGTPIYYADNLNIQKNLSPSELINYVDIEAIDNTAYCIREAKQKRVEELSSRARRVLKNGFIIYSTVRPYLKNIAIIEDELPNMIGSTGFTVFKPIQIETKYFFYFLLNPDLNAEYEKMMIGFNSPSITNTQFENTLLPIPPLSEQKRIVAKLDELMQYCDELEASIKESQQQNELLLQQVLREALESKSAILS